jgi:uncharacterized protein YjbI with pentapeptide repeats
LEAPSTISKLVGVSVLSGYLDSANKDAHRQILFTIAVLMATEKDPQTQVAVIDLMNSIPKDSPIVLADWHYFQDVLVTQSRALVAKADLTHHRQFQPTSPLTDDERAARTVGKLIAGNVRKGVVEDYRNYRGIYCEECDFHGAAFPNGTDFAGAILDRSNFSGARLEAAVFDNAELAGTRFVGADLRQARFRSLDESLTDVSSIEGDRVAFGRTAYIDHIVSALDAVAIVDIRMPNFSCANLAEANFDHHSLFPTVILLQRSYAKGDQNKPGWYQNVPAYIKEKAQTEPKVEFLVARIWPPKFLKANIKGAHLEGIRSFDFEDLKEPFSDYMAGGYGIRVADIVVEMGELGDEAFVKDPQIKGGRTEFVVREISRFQGRIKAAFYLVELDGALLPELVTDFLKKSPPDSGDFGLVFRMPYGAGSDPDLECTTRR